MIDSLHNVYLLREKTVFRMHFISFSAPASPPTNITGHAVDSTIIVLTWSPPQPRDQNGIIRNYTINVNEQNTGRQFSLVSDDTHETLSSLHPFYIYLISIRAVTIAGGPYSTQIAIQTEEYCK